MHCTSRQNKECLKDNDPRAVKSITDFHYVDDMVDSFTTEEEAVKITQEVCKIHRDGGFNLRNFVSNSTSVLKHLRGSAENVILAEKNELSGEKVLGITWEPTSDTFQFKIKFNYVEEIVLLGKQVPTKRQLLSIVMSMFDPMGFISKFVINAKLLLREVWKNDIGWDDLLSTDLNKAWQVFREQLKKVEQFSIPRHYFDKTLPKRSGLFCSGLLALYSPFQY